MPVCTINGIRKPAAIIRAVTWRVNDTQTSSGTRRPPFTGRNLIATHSFASVGTGRRFGGNRAHATTCPLTVVGQRKPTYSWCFADRPTAFECSITHAPTLMRKKLGHERPMLRAGTTRFRPIGDSTINSYSDYSSKADAGLIVGTMDGLLGHFIP